MVKQAGLVAAAGSMSSSGEIAFHEACMTDIIFIRDYGRDIGKTHEGRAAEH